MGLMPGHTAVQAVMGGWVACALLDDGRVQCWGRRPGHGSSLFTGLKLGDNEPASDGGTVALVNGSTATFVTCGESHCCAILLGGDLQALTPMAWCLSQLQVALQLWTWGQVLRTRVRCWPRARYGAGAAIWKASWAWPVPLMQWATTRRCGRWGM